MFRAITIPMNKVHSFGKSTIRAVPMVENSIYLVLPSSFIFKENRSRGFTLAIMEVWLEQGHMEYVVDLHVWRQLQLTCHIIHCPCNFKRTNPFWQQLFSAWIFESEVLCT